MTEYLTNPVFKFAVLPIGTAVLGIGLKFFTRNDRYAQFRKEDLAVGLDLTLTACLMFVVLTTDRAATLIQANKRLAEVLAQNPIDGMLAGKLQAEAQAVSSQIATSGWIIAILFLGLGAMSAVVRRWGWQSETELKPVVGIAIPLLYGILAVIGVMASAVR